MLLLLSLLIFHLSILHLSSWTLINTCKEKYTCPRHSTRAVFIHADTDHTRTITWTLEYNASRDMVTDSPFYAGIIDGSTNTGWPPRTFWPCRGALRQNHGHLVFYIYIYKVWRGHQLCGTLRQNYWVMVNYPFILVHFHLSAATRRDNASDADNTRTWSARSVLNPPPVR